MEKERYTWEAEIDAASVALITIEVGSVGPNWPGNGQPWREIQQLWPRSADCGPIWTELGRTRPRLGRDIELDSTNIDQPWLEFHQIVPHERSSMWPFSPFFPQPDCPNSTSGSRSPRTPLAIAELAA